MSTEEFTIALFCRVDEVVGDVPKHPQAALYPSELVTLALLFALKGGGGRAFYRWIVRDLAPLFPTLPERTRLFRLFTAHHAWVDYFLAAPTVLGVADTYGIELIHPWRAGRNPQQIGRKGTSNHRCGCPLGRVGGKLALVLNQWGLVAAWDCDTANVYDATFQPLVAQFVERMIVLTDGGFHAATGDPPNMKVCHCGEWNDRMGVETVLSMLTVICHTKQMHHRVWAYFRAHLGWLMAVFNLLVQWHGLTPDDEGRIRLSIAAFSL
jgi:hypothetical protein